AQTMSQASGTKHTCTCQQQHEGQKVEPNTQTKDATDYDGPEGEGEQAEQMPHGAKCLKELYAHVKANLPVLEPDHGVHKLYTKLMPLIATTAQKAYPDMMEALGIDSQDEGETEETDEENKAEGDQDAGDAEPEVEADPEANNDR